MHKEVIGKCTLYQGDCFEILPEIGGADCVITDPPYGCTCNSWDRKIDLARFWELARASAKEGAVFCVFCQMPFAADLYHSNREMFRYEYVYVKPKPTGFLDARKKPLRAHELIYVFCRRMPPYLPQMTQGEPYRKRSPSAWSDNYGKFTRRKSGSADGKRFPTTILDVRHDADFYAVNHPLPMHPTQKSVAACLNLVKTYSQQGDCVLDPFMGHASAGVAALKSGRSFIGIEKEKKYFDVACKYIEAAYAKRGLLEVA